MISDLREVTKVCDLSQHLIVILNMAIMNKYQFIMASDYNAMHVTYLFVNGKVTLIKFVCFLISL